MKPSHVFCHTHLRKDKRRIVFEEDLAGADGADGGGAAAEGALARFLGSRVHSLPASMSRGQVWPRHPAVIPNMEVPTRYIRFRQTTKITFPQVTGNQ